MAVVWAYPAWLLLHENPPTGSVQPTWDEKYGCRCSDEYSIHYFHDWFRGKVTCVPRVDVFRRSREEDAGFTPVGAKP